MSDNLNDNNSDFNDSEEKQTIEQPIVVEGSINFNSTADSTNSTADSTNSTADSTNSTADSTNSAEENSDSDKPTSKVYLSKEEAEAECKFQTHNSLLSLGRQLAKDKSKKEGLENLYEILKDKYKDLPDFDLNQVDSNFNIESYLYLNFKKESFKIIDHKELYQLYILYLLADDKYTKQVTENSLLKNEIEDLNEQGEEYIKQIDDMENEEKEKEGKIAKRIINLRQKCIDRRVQINRMWYTIFFLCYTSVFTLKVTLEQMSYVYNNLMIPFLQKILFLGISSIKYMIVFLMTYKIFLGMLISFGATYLYLNYLFIFNKKIMHKKEN